MQRQRAFSGPDARENYLKSGHFLLGSLYGKTKSRDWCDKKGVAITKAAGEGIGASGAFVVPDVLENAILDLRDAVGAFRRRALVWPMGSDSSSFPRRVSGTTASFFAENTAAPSAAFVMDQVKLTAKKLGAYILLSNELDEDSIFDLVNYVTNELAWAFANKEDQCAFNGDGTSTYAGMKGVTQYALDGNHGMAKVTAASGHNTFATLNETDLAALMAGVRASARTRAAWFVSQTGFSEGLLTGVNNAYLERGETDGIPTTFFNGYPVIPTQALPLIQTTLTGKAMMVFGDMYAGAVLGQRRGLTIAVSEHRFMDTDQMAVRATERFDAVVHDVGDNTLAGSLAVLVAP